MDKHHTPRPDSSLPQQGQEPVAKAGRRHLIEINPLLFDEGDVLLFRWKPHLPAKHCGIATSRRSMIHSQEGAAVAEVALNRWWLQRIAFAFRFPELDI